MPRPSPSLADEARRLDAEFTAALGRGDAGDAVRAALELEARIRAWSADTLTTPEHDVAPSTLRSMITRLGDAAVAGLRDPRHVAGPYVEILMELRAAVRAEGRYDLSDTIRDRLGAAGVEVRDTPTGPEWTLTDPP